jgi:hypothetical protein
VCDESRENPEKRYICNVGIVIEKITKYGDFYGMFRIGAPTTHTPTHIGRYMLCTTHTMVSLHPTYIYTSRDTRLNHVW